MTTIQSIQQVLARYRLQTATIRKLGSQKGAKKFYDKYEVTVPAGIDEHALIEIFRELRGISTDITLIERLDKTAEVSDEIK